MTDAEMMDKIDREAGNRKDIAWLIEKLTTVLSQRDTLLEALKKLSAACQASGLPEELERDFRAALIHAEFAIAKAEGKEAP